VFISPLFLIFLLVGAFLWVYYQENPMKIPLPEYAGNSGMKKSDFIYLIFMITEIPHIMRGFLIVAILSAAISSGKFGAYSEVSDNDSVLRGKRLHSDNPDFSDSHTRAKHCF